MSAAHRIDSECALDGNGQCVVCGVSHANACPICGRRGFHADACPENDERDDVARAGKVSQ